MEGWLTKKGHRVNNWKRRWFELFVDNGAGVVRLRYWTNELKTDLKGEHHITMSTSVFSVPVDGPHKFCFKLVAKGTKNSEELLMDADTHNLRLKWIMAIEAHILELKEQGGYVEPPKSASGISSSLSTVSISNGNLDSINSVYESTEENNNNFDSSDDNDILFSALSSKKLSIPEIQILEAINVFVDSWMNGKEQSFRNAVVSDFSLTVHSAEFMVTAVGPDDCWNLRSRAFTTPLQSYSLASQCVLSSTRAIASLFVFSSQQRADATPLEDYEVTFLVNDARTKLIGVEFNRIDIVTVVQDDTAGAREDLPETEDELVASKVSSATTGNTCTSETEQVLALLMASNVRDIDALAGVCMSDSVNGASNIIEAAAVATAAEAATIGSSQEPTVACAGMRKWLSSCPSECKSSLKALLEWTQSRGIDRSEDSEVVVKYTEYLVVPDYIRKLTKAELDGDLGSASDSRSSIDDNNRGSNVSNGSVSSVNNFAPSRSSSTTTRVSSFNFKANELVNVSVQLPAVDGVQSVTLNFAVPMNNTVEQLQQMIFNKLKALGNPLTEEKQRLTVLKVVGLKEYLLRLMIPLYMYDCAARCSRLQENLALLLHPTTAEEHQALMEIRNSKLSSIVSKHEENYGPSSHNIPLKSASDAPGTPSIARGGAERSATNSGNPTEGSFDLDDEDDDEQYLEKDSSSSLFYVRVHGIQFPLNELADGSRGVGHRLPFGYDSFHIEISLYYNGDDIIEVPLTTSSVTIPAHVLALNQAVNATLSSNSINSSISSSSSSSLRVADASRTSSAVASDAVSQSVRIASASFPSFNYQDMMVTLSKPLDIRIPGGALSTNIAMSNIPETARVVLRLMGNISNTFGPPTSVLIGAASVCVFDHRNVLNCSRFAINDCPMLKHGLGKRGSMVPLFEATLADRTVDVSPGEKDNNSGSPNSKPAADQRNTNSNEFDEEDDEEDANIANTSSPSGKAKKQRKEKAKKLPPIDYATAPPGTNLSKASSAISLIVSFDWPTPGKLITCARRCLSNVENEALLKSSGSLGNLPVQAVTPTMLAPVKEEANSGDRETGDEDDEDEQGSNLGPITAISFAAAESLQQSAGSTGPGGASMSRRKGGANTLRQRRNVSVISKRASAPTRVPTDKEWTIIDSIDKLDPLSELDPDAAMVLWDCRKSCASRPSLLAKFLKSVWWTSATATAEARKMLLVWSPCLPVEALELLDIRFSDPIVREFAVQRLALLPDERLQELLLQLVQVLKYEPYHDSPLARFLLRRALLSPLTIGHYFFWMLRSEMHIPVVRDRFGVLLTVYLARCGNYRNSLREQIVLNDQLTAIAVAIKSIATSKRSEFESSHKSVYARENVAKLVPKLPAVFTLSLSPKVQCSGINVNKCFVLSSKKMPLWVQFINSDGLGLEYPVIFKVGDDLRQDQLTLQLIRIMDSLWRGEFNMGDSVDTADGGAQQFKSPNSRLISGNAIAPQTSKITKLKFMSMSMFGSSNKQAASKAEEELRSSNSNSSSNGSLCFGEGSAEPVLDLRMKSYGCCSTALDVGFIEVVPSSSTCANIQTDYGGKITGAWSNNTIVDYLKNANGKADYDLAVDNFARTCAGYCVATYVMGIGDRHGDNIMVSKAGHLFHIDFGHFLGNFKSFKGINRERNPFVFTPEMAQVLRNQSPAVYAEFESMCCRAYNSLRRRGALLITLFALMIPAGMPELLKKEDIHYLRDMLSLELTEEQASEKFLRELKNCLGSFSRRLDNWFHNLKHKT